LDNLSDNTGAISLSVDKASFCRTPAPPTIADLQSHGVVALAKIRRNQQSQPQESHSAGGCRIRAKKKEWGVKEISLSERIVAALKPREENKKRRRAGCRGGCHHYETG
jgi:hypothetical protein